MYDTIIIGGGIAGLTAAIYAARKRMKFAIISTDFGGNFMISGDIENYPGILKTTGYDFLTIMKKQMDFNNIKVIIDTVTKIKKKDQNFLVIAGKKEHDSRSVIIATGSTPKKLGIPGEDTFAKKGVTYCSVCDGPLFAGMDVAVVGGGNSALQAADSLKDIASKIYLITNEDTFRAHEYLIERVKKNHKIEIFYNTEITEVVGDSFVKGITYKQKGKSGSQKVRGLIIEIGRIPDTGQFKGLVKFDSENHIHIDCQTRTSVPGIFAAGDCTSGHESQYVISAGQGAMALLKVAKYLATKKG
jgi:thioredoxin-disulfide reductase